jgi:hypothetical protein
MKFLDVQEMHHKRKHTCFHANIALHDDFNLQSRTSKTGIRNLQYLGELVLSCTGTFVS